MRNILSRLVVMSTVVAASFATNAAMAETRLQVPFSFTVGSQNWPAGIYLIEKTQVNDTVVLQSSDSQRSVSLSLAPGDPAPNDSRIMLTFTEDHEAHALKSLQYGSKVGKIHRKSDEQNERLPVRMVQGQ